MKLIIFSSVLILFLFGLTIPNSYGQTDEITMSITTELSEYYPQQNILIEGHVSKFIPNTPITYSVYTEGGIFGEEQIMHPIHNLHINLDPDTGKFDIRILFLDCDPNWNGYTNSGFECKPDGKVMVKVFYGLSNDYFTTAKTTFYLNTELDEIGNKIKNYFPTKKTQIGINTDVWEYDPHLSHYSPWATYWDSVSYSDQHASIKYYEDGIIKLDNKDCSYFGGTNHCSNLRPLHGVGNIEFLNSTNTPEIPKDFECLPRAERNSYGVPIEECWNGSLLIKISSDGSSDRTGGIGFVMKAILENIEANPISTEKVFALAEPILEPTNCGSGTELVNGICQVVQTEEKTAKGEVV